LTDCKARRKDLRSACAKKTENIAAVREREREKCLKEKENEKGDKMIERT
jgi:hypothetical protein